MSGTVAAAQKTVAAAQNYAQSTANSAIEIGKAAVHGATTTVTAYTPGPVQTLIHTTLEGAKAFRQDPVGTLKPYVPTFVIHAGEKTYEIVHAVQDRTAQNINATTAYVSEKGKATHGYIVTKVNGTVQYVTSIPQVRNQSDLLSNRLENLSNNLKS